MCVFVLFFVFLWRPSGRIADNQYDVGVVVGVDCGVGIGVGGGGVGS